jgi:Zn finger protein HypA/HybF involved in hydrogenase expression
MSAMCHDCGTYIDEDVETLCPGCKNGDKKISNQNFSEIKGVNFSNIKPGNAVEAVEASI